MRLKCFMGLNRAEVGLVWGLRLRSDPVETPVSSVSAVRRSSADDLDSTPSIGGSGGRPPLCNHLPSSPSYPPRLPKPNRQGKLASYQSRSTDAARAPVFTDPQTD